MEHVVSRRDLGVLLGRLRSQHGYSYRALSAATGINPGTLERWEKGRHSPILSSLTVLLRFYGETVTIGWDPQGGEGS